MKLLKTEIVRGGLHIECIPMVSDEDWQILSLFLWKNVEEGLALNHSTQLCEHTIWGNWIGSVK